MIAEKLADAIIAKRSQELEKKIQRYPRRNMILSDISECDRANAYGILEWDKRQMFDADIQSRLDAGNLQELHITSELSAMGFQLTLTQQPCEIKNKHGEVIATGKVDGFITYDNEKVPIEIKSMHPNLFNQVKSLEDFQKKPHLRKYIRQLQMYCLANNKEAGLFIITNCLGSWKLLPMYLDYETAEYILQRLERVHQKVKEKSLPDRIPYDPEMCDRCPFSNICLQDIIRKPAETINDPATVELIDRHEYLKPLASEYDQIHDNIKKAFKDVDKALIGDKYLIQNLPSQRTTYELSDDAKARIEAIKKECAQKITVKIMKIENLNKNQEQRFEVA